MVSYFIAYKVVEQLDTQQQQTKQGLQTVEQENYCLVAFFLRPDRQNITLANLQACDPVLGK
jgi:hypothetical protein